MFIESLCRNWPPLHSLCFFPFVTSHGSLLRARYLLYFWRTLMKFRDPLNFSTLMVFVIMSAGFFFILIFTKSITLSCMIHWHTLWSLTSMCFVSLWYPWSLIRWIALWLSQWTRNESCVIPKVSFNSLNYKVFFDVTIAAMYSASIVERAIISCNSAFQLITRSANVNT